MPAIEILKYLPFTCTQGGADAFVEATITTDLVPANGYAFEVDRIECAFTTACGMALIAAASEISFAMAKDTKLAVPELTDQDAYFKIQGSCAPVASATLVGDVMPSFIVRPDKMVIVEPEIYAQLDSTNTTKTLVLNGRIFYREVKLTEVEILRLLNNA
jgi:hypothetical protein